MRTSVGRPTWMSPSTPSTACWSSDARATSAPPDPRRGRGQCARTPDPCTTLAAARPGHHRRGGGAAAAGGRGDALPPPAGRPGRAGRGGGRLVIPRRRERLGAVLPVQLPAFPDAALRRPPRALRFGGRATAAGTFRGRPGPRFGAETGSGATATRGDSSGGGSTGGRVAAGWAGAGPTASAGRR